MIKNLDEHRTLVSNLKKSADWPHSNDNLQLLETHISSVLLVGDYAYKIKKPLDLGFLDFSTLEKRQGFCQEELRLNGRLAPAIYLEVVPITGSVAEPKVGGEGEAIEYAVKMRRFSQDSLLIRQQLTPDLMTAIAQRAGLFHAQIPSAAADSELGTPDAVFFPMQQNFDQIRGLLDDPDELQQLNELETWTQATYQASKNLLAQRKAAGYVRECHGDMHLGNIALVDGEITIFDGIEFNPSLRWIDTMNEVAFLVMDLEQAKREELAQRFLNAYLVASGDYRGLPLLNFYKVYRALVRAKVTAIRLAQPHLSASEKHAVMREYGRYITLAEGYIQPKRPLLVITQGVSGTGKSRLSQVVADRLPAIWLRSDVERKRQAGLAASARTQSPRDGGIYTPEMTEKTYAELRDVAALCLDSGCHVLVDATFLKTAQRRSFQHLAETSGCAFRILSLTASPDILRERVAIRAQAGVDPSEANVAVLEAQLASKEPFDVSERSAVIEIDTDSGTAPIEDIIEQLRNS